MLALILLWLHLPRAWRSALFASLLRSASGFSVSISPNRNHASPHCCWMPSQRDSCAIAEHQLRKLRPTDCCVLSQHVGVRHPPHLSKRRPCLGRHEKPADQPPLHPPRSGWPEHQPARPPELHGCRSHISKYPGRNPTRRVDSDRRPGACSSLHGTPDTTRQPRNLTIRL